VNFLRRYEELGETFDPETVKLKKVLRVSELKVEREETLSRLKKAGVVLREIPFLDKGYEYEANFSVASTPEYLLGHVYVQEAASQLPVKALDPRPGELVCDMAAAPGSKTTQIADLMKNSGKIIALDSDSRRLIALRNNLERMGVSNVLLYKKDARFLPDFGMKFDRILLDAPCSGNFCIEPEYFEKKNKEGIIDRSKIQRELIKAAVKCLKPGGVLVYSTCSLEPEEDEMVVDWVLGKISDLKIVDVELGVGDSGIVNPFGKELSPKVSKCVRIWPHKTGMQGFFVAKFVKDN
jgi:NOL1/NOP2/sun family putative RNA methylase